MWKEITQETTLSNNKTLRSVSDWLDGKGFRGAGRAITHATYHAVIGTAKFLVFNREGARAEFKRVGQQLRRVGHTPERPPNNVTEQPQQQDPMSPANLPHEE